MSVADLEQYFKAKQQLKILLIISMKLTLIDPVKDKHLGIASTHK